MINASPEVITIVMFGGLAFGLLIGYPLAFSIAGVGLIVGYLIIGPKVFNIVYLQMFGLMRSYVLLAVPLFIFMGCMLERSLMAKTMYEALYLFLGRIRGGLALVTILLGTIIAACVGVVAAAVSMLTLLALPEMMRRGYNKSIASGAICAAGNLGILIPPSIMLIVYAAMAKLSVGKLYMAAIFPGLLLSALYCIYILITCSLQPQLAPILPPEEFRVPLTKKVSLVIVSIIPTGFVILAVLGTIYLGIAPPTEAAAAGALATTILAMAYRKFNLRVLKEVSLDTLLITSFCMFIGAGSVAFTGVFLDLGCGKVVQNLVLAVPLGRWGAFLIIMFMYFILGFLVDWIGIMFIMVPIVAPIAPLLGFDPIWFGMMICVNLQTASLTPPLAYAMFYLQGLAPPEFGITTADIMRGMAPYIVLILIGLALCVVFPQIILWLPEKMIA